MDAKDCSHRWIWNDDGYGLDSESPLAISHCLWEDLTHSEAGVRTLFASTPESEIKEIRPPLISFEKESSANAESSGQQMCDDSPRFKRRRMLQFPGEQENLDSYHSDLEPVSEPLSSNVSHIGGYRDFQLQYDPEATNSLWHVANDGSMSSVEDVGEQSAERWMTRCFGDTEPYASQNLTESWMARRLDETDAEAWQNQMNVEWPCPGRGDFRRIDSVSCGGDAAEGPSAFLLPKPAFSERRQVVREATARRPQRAATPVAYPFAVVKPSGMQGDVTLNDINQRIMMRRSNSARPVLPQLSSSSTGAGRTPNMSGKSVVALTKIHTEGNGTITILRTKN